MTLKAFSVIAVRIESENEETVNRNADEFEEYIIEYNKNRETKKKKTQSDIKAWNAI